MIKSINRFSQQMRTRGVSLVRFLLVSVVLFSVVAASVYTYTRPGVSTRLGLTPAQAEAATSSNLNYQARLLRADGSLVPDGYYNIEFKLYSVSTGGSALWTETYYDANGTSPGQDNRVRVVNGYLSVNLASQTAFPGTMNWDQDLWLTMNVGGATQTATPTYDGEMSPRIKLTAVPYAFQSQRAEQLAKTVSGFLGQLVFTSSLAQNTTYTLVDPGMAAVDICLSSGNCAGSGGGIVGSGTAGRITRFTASGTVADSYLLQGSGSLTLDNNVDLVVDTNSLVVDSANDRVGIGTATPSYKLDVQGGTGIVAQFSGRVKGGDAVNNDEFVTLSQLNASGGGTNYIINDVANQSSANFNITSAADGDITGVLRARASQSVDVLQVQNSAGTAVFGVDRNGNVVAAGSVQVAGITNTGSTLNTAGTITDLPTGGVVGTAAATVDAKTTLSVNQTTTGQTLSLPSPTNTAAGRVVYVLNIGTADFTMHGVTIASGKSQAYIWTGSAWTPSGIDTGGSGASTIGALDGQSKSANGAVITGGALYLQTADATYSGLVSTTTQTFAGDKTFNGVVTAAASGTGLSVTNDASVGGKLTVGTYTYGVAAKLQINTGGGATNGIVIEAPAGQTGNYITFAGNGGIFAQITSNGSFVTNAGQFRTYSQGAAAVNSSQLTLQSGDASGAGAVSGNVYIDNGVGAAGNGAINIGTTNATGVTIGRAAGAITVLGNTTINTTGTATTAIGNISNSSNAVTISGGSSGGVTLAAGSTILSVSNTVLGTNSNVLQFGGGTAEIRTNGSATGNSNPITLTSGGSSGTSSFSGNVVIKSGDATGTTTNSGNVTIDVGTATGTAGNISIGTANATGVTLGRSTTTVTVAGTLSVNSASITNNVALGGSIQKTATAGTTGVTNGDVVVMADEGGNARVIQTTTPRDTRVYGIASTTASSGNSLGIYVFGSGAVNVDTAAVAIGDQLVTSGTAGRATVDNNATTGIIGYALAAKAGGSNGTVLIRINPVGGQSAPRFQNTTNSTTAFQIQNAAGTSNLFNADTTNTRIGIGTNTPAYTLDVSGGTGVVGRFSGRVIGGNAVNNDEFVTLAQLTASSGSGLTGSGTTNMVARWTGTGALGTGVLYDTGTLVGVGVSPATGASMGILQVGAVNAITADQGITFGGQSGVNLYRSSSSVLKTDSGFLIGGNNQIGGTLQVGGASTFLGAVTATGSSTSMFKVGASSGTTAQQNTIVVDTTNALVGIGAAPSTSNSSILQVTGGISATQNIGTNTNFAISSSSASGGGLYKQATVGTTGVAGADVVVLADESGSARMVTTTTARDTRVYGVSTGSIASGSVGAAYIGGNTIVNATAAAIAIGDQLVTSTTAGAVMADNNATTGIVGYATTSKAGGSAGTVGIRIQITNGQSSPYFRTTDFRVQDSSGATDLFRVDGTNQRLAIGPSALPANSVLTIGTNTTTTSGGITLGTDTSLYRSASNVLATSGALVAYNGISSQVALGRTATGIVGAGITFGNAQDTNVYRSAADVLATDDSFSLLGTSSNLTVQGTGTSSFAGNITIAGTLGVTGASTFTGLGTFNGGLTVANNSNFSQTGTGTFSTGTGTVTLNGNTTISGSNTFSSGTGAVSLNGATTVANNLTVTSAGNVAFQKGTDYSTVGSTNDVNLGTGSLFRLSGASAQTITGFAGGADGRRLTLVNAGANAATIANNSVSSAAANRITTGTGGNISIPPGASVELVYDATASLWRVTSDVAANGGAGVNTIGAIDSQTKSANGAVIAGTSLYLQTADATSVGLVSVAAQTFAGNKTFTGVGAFTAAGTALTVTNNATIGGTLGVTGATTTGSLSVTNAATIGTTLAVTGVTTLTGQLNANGGIVTNNTNINAGTGTITSGLINGQTISSVANFTGTVAVASNATIGGTLGVTGALTVNNTVDVNTSSSSALVVRNGATNTLAVDTANNRVGIGGPAANSRLTIGTNSDTTSVGGITFGTDTSLYRLRANVLQTDGVFTIASGSGGAYAKNYQTGASAVSANSVVVFNASGQIATTTTARDIRVAGIAATAVGASSVGQVVIAGSYQVTADTGAVAIGDQLVTSTTAGQVTVDNSATSGIVGRALTAKGAGSSGLVTTVVNVVNGQSNPNFAGAITVQGSATSIFGGSVQGLDATANNQFVTLGQANTNYAAASGSNNYIQNTTTPQTANFNITGNGTIGGNLSVVGTSSFTGNIGINTTPNANNRLAINAVTSNTYTDAAQLAINTGTASKNGLVIQGVAGQSGYYFAGVDSSGSLVSAVDANGSFIAGNGVFRTFDNGSGASGSATFRSGTTNIASSNSGNVILQSGNATGTTSNTGSVTIQSGNATNGTSGSITVDTGTGSVAAGSISIGATNASGVTIARTGVLTSIAGNASVGGALSVTGVATLSSSLDVAGASAFGNNASVQGSGATRSTVNAAQTYASLAGITDAAGIVNTLDITSASNTAANIFGNSSLLSLAGAGNYTGDVRANEDAFTFSGTGQIDVAIGSSSTLANANTGTISTASALQGNIFGLDGTITDAKGVEGVVLAADGNIGTAAGLTTAVGNYGTGTVTTGYGLLVNAAANLGGGTFTNNYGIYIEDQAVAGITNSYNLYSAGASARNFIEGKLQIGSTQTGSRLNIGTNSDTTAAGGILFGTDTSVYRSAANTLATDDSFTLFGTGSNLTVQGTGTSSFAGNIAVTGTSTFTGLGTFNGGLTVGSNSNFSQTGTGTFSTGTGAVTLNGATTIANNLTVTNAGNVAFQRGADYATTGTTNNVNFGTGVLFRLTGASAQTITGIANGADGRRITLVNASSAVAVLANDSASSLAANRIITGTGANINLPIGATVDLVYDSATARWRVTSGVAATGGVGVNTVGAIDSVAKSANGAVISGTEIIFQTADATYAGLVSTGVQTFAGNKTFNGTVTLAGAGTGLSVTNDASIGGNLTVTGSATFNGNVTLGNAASDTITFTGVAASTLDMNNNLITNIGNAGTDFTAGGGLTLAGLLTGNAGATLSGTNITTLGVSSVKSTATAGEAYGQQLAVSFNIADTGLKQALRVSATAGNTTGTLNDLIGGLYLNTAGGNGGTVANSNNLWVRSDAGTGATITTARGLFVNNGTGVGTIVDQYGIHVSDLTKGTNDYGIRIDGADTQVLWLGAGANNTDAANGIAFGSSRDTTLYRSAANTLATDDSFSLLGTGSNLTVQGTGTSAFSGNVTIGGTLAVTGTSTFTGLGTFNGGLTVANNSNFSQTGTGTFSTGTGANTLNGATTVNSTLAVISNSANAFRINDGSSDILKLDASNALSADLILGGNKQYSNIRFQQGGTNQWGIGTDDTSSTDSFFLYNYVTGSYVASFASNGAGLFKNSTNSTNGFVVQNAAGTTNVLNVDTANNRVGINTATPGYALDVQAGTGIVGNFSGRVRGANAVNNDEFVTLGQATGNYILNGSSPQTANFNITGTGTIGTLSVTNNATVGGTLTITGNTTLDGDQLTNNGSTLFGSSALSNFATNATIGTAAATVDIYTSFTINQTTTGRTLTLPNPTATAAGRVIIVSNIGTTGFTMVGVTVQAGKAQTYIWNGSAWTATNIDGAGSGATTIGTLDGTTKSADGGVISGNNLFLQTADATYSGLVSTSAQTFAGTKTFQNGIVLNTGAGLLQSSAGGVVSSGAVDRNSATFFANTLSVANGGTGATTLTPNGLLMGNGTSAISSIAPANNGVLITSGAGVPSISSTLPAAVQANITSVGTVTSGTWNGTALTDAFVSDTLTASLFVGSGSLTTAVDLATAEVSGVLGATNGGTGNAFTAFTGPTGTIKTFTLPDASATILTTNAAVTVGQGGTGVTTLATNGILFGNGTGAIQATVAANDSILITGGAGVPILSQTLPTIVQDNITRTGALVSGSIGTGFGVINTSNTITGTTLNGTTGINTGGTNRITSTGNLVNIGNITATGAITIQSTGAGNDIVLAPADIVALGSATTGIQITTAGVISDIDGSSVSINDSVDVTGSITISTGVNARGYSTTNTSNTFNGQYTLLGRCTITVQFQDCRSVATVVSIGDGGTTPERTTVDFRVKQQAALGGAPYISVQVSDNSTNMNASHFNAVTTVNTGASTVVELYGQINPTFQSWAINPTISTGSGSQVVWLASQGFNAALPGGTVTPATYYGQTVSNLDSVNSVAFRRGTDFSTTGTTNNASFSDASLIRLTGASAQTITGIAGGRDGEVITLVNSAAQAATITNNDAASTAANRIITGTGASISLPAGSSITIVYDAGASLWRVTSAVAASGGVGVNTIGAIDSQTKSANGAVISGTSLILQTADATSVGLVSTGAQTFAGAKTFQDGIVLNTGAGLLQSSSGGAITSGAVDRNSATFFSNALSVANGGTGLTTVTTNGILFGNGTSALQVIAPANNGVLITSGAGVPSISSTLPAAVQTNITNTGILTVGSIASGFGSIATANTITGTTLNGTTGINTGAGAGTQRIDVNGNLVNIGTITSGAINGQTISSTANFTGTVNVASNFSVATNKLTVDGVTGNTVTQGTFTVNGSEFTNTGSTIFTAATITNKATGGDIGTAGSTVDIDTVFNVSQTTASQTLTLPNPTANTVTGRLAYINNIGSASFTMYGVVVPSGGTASFMWVYNGTTGSWVPTASGVGVNAIGTINAVTNGAGKSANGAVISGSNLILQTADATSVGLVSTGAQTFAGAKTFSGVITGQAGAAISGGAVDINNSGSGNTTIGNGSSGTVTIGGSGSGNFVLQGAQAATYQLGASNRIGIMNIGVSNTNNNGIFLGTGTGATSVHIGADDTTQTSGAGVYIGTKIVNDTIMVGGDTQTGTLTIGRSTKSNVINIGNANTEATLTQSINIGAGTSVAGATQIKIGQIAGSTTTTQIYGGTGTGAIQLQTGTGSTIQIATSGVNNGVQIGNTNSGVAQTFGIGNNTNASGSSAVTIGSLIGSSATTIQGGTTGTVNLQTGAGGTVNIATSGVANTVQIGNTNAAVAQTFGIGNNTNASGSSAVTIGSLIGSSATTIQGGTTGTVNLQTGAGGTINIATANAGNTVQIGNIANAVTQTINIGTNPTAGSTTTLTLGSLIGSSVTNIRGGTGTTAIGIQTGAGGTVNIATSGVANTVQIGNTNAAVAQTFGIGNNTNASGSSAVTIGSLIGSSATTIQGGTTGTVNLQTGAGGTINIATANAGNTVQIGNIANAVTQTINIGTNPTAGSTTTLTLGSLIGSSATTIQGGTTGTAVALQTAGGNISIGTNGQGNTIQIGNTTGTNTQTINIGTNTTATSSNIVNIGSQQGASTTNITAGSGLINLLGYTIAKPVTDGNNAFRIQDSSGTTLFNVDTFGSKSVQVFNTDTTTLFNADQTNGYVFNNGVSAVGSLIDNPGFEAASDMGFRNGWDGDCTIQTNAANAHSGNKYAEYAATSSEGGCLSKLYSVTPGDTIYAEGWVYSTGNGQGGFYVAFLDKDRANPSFANSVWTNPGTTWTRRTISATVPAGMFYMRLHNTVRNDATTGVYRFDDVYLSKANENGPALFKNNVNSTTAFQIQDAGGQSLFGADTTTNKIKVGNSTGTNTAITLFQLDSASAAGGLPTGAAYLGSMYYDTDSGRIQCYQSSGWGACGAAPDNIITLTPEYSNMVLNGTGVGTLTSDFCGNGGGLTVNTTLCSTSGDTRNFYKWTSPQSSDQTYSLYVSYKLPSTFKSFADNNTIKLTGLTTDTANGSVVLSTYIKDVSAGTLSLCGSATTITSANNTWQTVSQTGNETSCGFAGGDYIVFKIDVMAKNSASVYVENLDFVYSNQ